MKIKGTAIEPGITLFFPHVTASGNTLWKSGTVVDTNEHVHAVKLRFGEDGKKLKSQYFPAKDLRLTDPTKEDAFQVGYTSEYDERCPYKQGSEDEGKWRVGRAKAGQERQEVKP